MSKIRDYIAKHNIDTFDDLRNELSNKNLELRENDELCLIKYDRTKVLVDDFIRDCRGTIIDKSNNQILVFPIKGKNTNEEFFSKVIWNDCVVEESIDGTLVTLYYFNNNWNISTKGSLDANCYWNSKKSFRELFLEAADNVGLNFNILKHNYTYSFVLCHPNCRNITQYSSPNLYHISSRNVDSLEESDEDIDITKPRILKLDEHNITGADNYESLVEKLGELNYSKEGFMLYSKNRKYRTKLYGKSHLELKNLKGNEANILIRLLNLRTNFKNGVISGETVDRFFKHFPEYYNNYFDIEFKLDTLSKEVHNYYCEKYKLRTAIDIPKKYQRLVIELHEEYKKLMNKYDPENHSYKPNITLKKVIHYLENNVDYSYLAYLINEV